MEPDEILDSETSKPDNKKKVLIVMAFLGLTLILISLTKKKEEAPKKVIKKKTSPRPIVVNVINGKQEKETKPDENNTEENEEENNEENNEGEN